MYDKTSELTEVNLARKALFTKGRQLDHILPTEAALIEHTKRASYQAGYIWGQALVAQQHIPSPNEWGWTNDSNGNYIPYWSLLPEASKSCKELIKCGCIKSCRPPC